MFDDDRSAWQDDRDDRPNPAAIARAVMNAWTHGDDDDRRMIRRMLAADCAAERQAEIDDLTEQLWPGYRLPRPARQPRWLGEPDHDPT